MGPHRIGLAVSGSEYGEQIRAHLAGLEWDLETVDRRHPHIDGAELHALVVWADGDGLRLIEALGNRPELAILAVGDDSVTRTDAARALVGRLGYVSWPILADELLPRLRARLQCALLHRRVAGLEAELSAAKRALGAAQGKAVAAVAELESASVNLATATERLVTAEQLAAVGRVVGGIAHEIASQLALVGYAEAIKSRVVGDPELSEFADVIVSAQKRLATMVDEIRDFAAASSGDGTSALSAEPAELASVVDEALALLRYDPMVRARHVERRYRRRPLVTIERKRMMQVVINLVSNAVLATEEGATIAVEVAQEGPWAQLKVVDSGVGMSADVAQRLGEIFFTTRGPQGSGLGVGICKRIVEDHGGRLSFASAPGQGTTALVELPLLAEAGK